MRCAEKLAIDFGWESARSLDVEKSHRFNRPQKYAAEWVNVAHKVPLDIVSLTDECADKIIESLPTMFCVLERPKVSLLEMTSGDHANPWLYPHIDVGRLCAVNIYLECHGERTVFYEEKDSRMEEVESFVASNNDCWLIDTSTPHAVQLVPRTRRRMVTLSYVLHKFEDVLRSIKSDSSS